MPQARLSLDQGQRSEEREASRTKQLRETGRSTQSQEDSYGQRSLRRRHELSATSAACGDGVRARPWAAVTASAAGRALVTVDAAFLTAARPVRLVIAARAGEIRFPYASSAVRSSRISQVTAEVVPRARRRGGARCIGPYDCCRTDKGRAQSGSVTEKTPAARSRLGRLRDERE